MPTPTNRKLAAAARKRRAYTDTLFAGLTPPPPPYPAPPPPYPAPPPPYPAPELLQLRADLDQVLGEEVRFLDKWLARSEPIPPRVRLAVEFERERLKNIREQVNGRAVASWFPVGKEAGK